LCYLVNVYFGSDEADSDIIVELVEAVEGSDVLGYVLKDEGFLFESSIAYSEKELNGESK
jgi:hypothetical protein